MRRRTERTIREIQEAPDEAFVEIADTIAKRAAETPVEPKDETVHILDLKPVLEQVRADKGKLKGLSTGYRGLDKRMGGLEAGSVILVSGDTSQGKSALATNVAANVAKEHGVLYVSLEMTKEQMLDRLDAVHPDPPSLNLAFQKSFALSYKDLEPLVKKAVHEHSVKLVVLDYLQYLGRGMTHTETAQMSQSIKSLALRYKVCMLVITSLRKGSAEVKFRRKWSDVTAEDVMGTAAIAYDADTIVIASRKDLENEYDNSKMWVKVLKTRNSELRYDDCVCELAWDNTKLTEEWISI